MGQKPKYSADIFIKAMAGSGGVYKTIARNADRLMGIPDDDVERPRCSTDTVKRWIADKVTVQAAYDAALDETVDLAEGILIGNMKIQAERQDDLGVEVDSADAKWFLARKGRARGYGDKTELDVGVREDDPATRSIIDLITAIYSEDGDDE